MVRATDRRVAPGSGPRLSAVAHGVLRFSGQGTGYGPQRASVSRRVVMMVRHYLLVLDMDLLAVDEEFDLEPINYFLAQQEREPCYVTVLSLVDTSSARLPAMELLLGAKVGKFPVAPRPSTGCTWPLST